MNNEIWKLEEAKIDLFPHLFLSYNELSPALRRCFSYCAGLAKDFLIWVDDLIDDWMALGYLGSDKGDDSIKIRGREYFNSLVMHSFFLLQVENRVNDGKVESCRMHHIVHDFARFLRENGRVDEENSCSQVCHPSLVSRVRQYRSLYLSKDEDPRLCDCLSILRVLDLSRCGWKNIQVEKFIHLRRLKLQSVGLPEQDVKKICKLYILQSLTLSNCDLKQIPSEIGNLIHLRLLDLSENEFIQELPETIGDLHELQTLNIDMCSTLSALPDSIDKLINLKYLDNNVTFTLTKYPKGLGKLTGLRRFQRFNGGRDSGKFKTLKNLNCLTGCLVLLIKRGY